MLWLPPAVLQQAYVDQGRGWNVLLGVLEDCPPHPHEQGETAMVGLFLQHTKSGHRKGFMSEHKQVGQELWICKAAQCIVPPSTHIVLQGNDQHFYPARLVEVGTESLIDWTSLDSGLMGFEEHKDALSFCLKISLHISLHLSNLS